MKAVDVLSQEMLGVIFLIVITQAPDSLAQCEGSSFSKLPFVKLDGNILQAIAVPNILQCCWKCDRLPECLSLNVADVPDKDGLYECQMLRTETNKYSGLLKPSQHYHHYTRLVDKCTTVRCLNGGTCQSIACFDFRCVCPQGFTGQSCDQRISAVSSRLQSLSCNWVKTNASPVPFGTKNSSFARFYTKQSAKVTGVKLVRLSGFIACFFDADDPSKSFWGCADKLLTVITDNINQRILPQNEYITNLHRLDYALPSITPLSVELLYPNFSTPMAVTAGQEFRIWYGPDLEDYGEDMSEGTVYVDVYLCMS